MPDLNYELLAVAAVFGMVGVSLFGVGQRAPRQRRPAYYAMFALTELVAIVVAVMFFLDSAGLL